MFQKVRGSSFVNYIVIDLISKEIRSNLLMTRYLLFSLLTVILFLISTWIYIDRYEGKRFTYTSLLSLELERFNRVPRNRSALENHIFQVIRPPARLGFIVNGGEDYLPNVFGFKVGLGRIRFSSATNYNFALPRFIQLDWTFIASFLLPFAAIILAHNTITGEREEGTLRLVLSNAISRKQVIIGKFLAILFAIIVSLLVGICSSLLLVSLRLPDLLLLEDVPKLTIWLAASITLLSFYVLIGITMSSITRGSPQSLYLSLIIWIVMVMLVPSAARITADYWFPLETEVEIAYETRAMWREQGAGTTSEHAKALAQQVATIYDQQLKSRLDQAKFAIALAKLSPNGIVSDLMNKCFSTGFYKLEDQLTETALMMAVLAGDLEEGVESIQHPSEKGLMAELAAHSEKDYLMDVGWLIAANLTLLCISYLALARSDV